MTKIKVALCMRGAVGLTSMPSLECGDLYKSNNYIDYIKCYKSIVKYIILPNSNDYDFDIFCHCWNTDLESELSELYSPKKKLFEDNTPYNDEINELISEQLYGVNKGDFGGISNTISTKKSIELKEEYEKENNIKYDIVILYRYDVLLWKSMILSEYPNIHDTVYVNAHWDCGGDFHFVMNNENAMLFKGLYNSLKLGNTHRVHYWIKMYVLNYMKVNISMDSIQPGIHQEVYRKVEDYSINPGHLTREELNSI